MVTAPKWSLWDISSPHDGFVCLLFAEDGRISGEPLPNSQSRRPESPHMGRCRPPYIGLGSAPTPTLTGPSEPI
eukprot:1506172-Amphidinium_carterae.1